MNKSFERTYRITSTWFVSASSEPHDCWAVRDTRSAPARRPSLPLMSGLDSAGASSILAHSNEQEEKFGLTPLLSNFNKLLSYNGDEWNHLAEMRRYQIQRD